MQISKDCFCFWSIPEGLILLVIFIDTGCIILMINQLLGSSEVERRKNKKIIDSRLTQ